MAAFNTMPITTVVPTSAPRAVSAHPVSSRPQHGVISAAPRGDAFNNAITALTRPSQSRSFSGIVRGRSRHRLALRAVEAFTSMQHTTSFRGVWRRRGCRRCAQKGDDFNDASVADAGECLASRATELLRTSFQHIHGRSGHDTTSRYPFDRSGTRTRLTGTIRRTRAAT